MSLRVSSLEKVDGLRPPVLNFIKGHVAEYDSPSLGVLAGRLERSVVVDASLAMASEDFPQKSTKFRDEVFYLSYIIRNMLGEFEIKGDGKAFGNWVKSVSGADIANDEIHQRILETLGKTKANLDEMAFKLATGRMLARLAYQRIKNRYSKSIDDNLDLVAARRLGAILRRASDGCVFGKIGNQYIFQFFRGKLHCERTAVLEQYKTPFLEVGEQFGDECNDIVRPVTDSLCKEQFDAIDWDSSTVTDDFILATSILQEIVDNKIELLINTEVPFGERFPRRPSLFVFATNFDPTGQSFGIVEDTRLWSTASGAVPIFVTLYEFIRRYKGLLGDAVTTSIHHLVHCCETDADQIQATNPFKKYL